MLGGLEARHKAVSIIIQILFSNLTADWKTKGVGYAILGLKAEFATRGSFKCGFLNKDRIFILGGALI